MKYHITDGKKYVKQNTNGTYTAVTDINKASSWEKEKAINFLKATPKTLLKQCDELKVVPVGGSNPNFELNFKLDDFVDDLFNKTCALQDRKDFLLTELSRLDKERTDIEHAAEFYNLNASQGYKIYKMLHENGIERRKVKDEIYKINAIFGQTISAKGTETVKKSFEGLEDRKYEPRILKELFNEK